MKHFTVSSFWECYDSLPFEIKQLADKNYEILKQNPLHPSLHFKKIDSYWTVRIGLKYRAIAIEKERNIIWFWIGDHSTYDKLIQK